MATAEPLAPYVFFYSSSASWVACNGLRSVLIAPLAVRRGWSADAAEGDGRAVVPVRNCGDDERVRNGWMHAAMYV